MLPWPKSQMYVREAILTQVGKVGEACLRPPLPLLVFLLQN